MDRLCKTYQIGVNRGAEFQGVVTAGQAKGVVVQDPSASDPRGICVYTATQPAVHEGDIVEVLGTVTSYHGESEILKPTVTVFGATLPPAPISIADPATIATSGRWRAPTRGCSSR